MTELERYITIISLINAAIFYAVTVVIFLIARKSRLNYALAAQKFVWLCIILFVALPGYVVGRPYLDGTYRMVFWSILSAMTWWVLIEVYRVNCLAVKQFLCSWRPVAWLARKRGKC